MPPQPPDVDALRQKLRSLGYLDAGVDRFVLAPARSSLSAWGLAWRASVRLGLLGALLIGAPATVAVALRLPSLVTGQRDVIVLAVYFCAVAAMVTGAAALAATLFAVRVRRRALRQPSLTRWAVVSARTAGVLVTVLCLGYLTLWWRVVSGSAAAPFGATALALVLATSVAVLLGHTTTTIALAVLARDVPGDGAASSTRRSWRRRAAAGALALAASAMVTVLAPRSGTPVARETPPLVVIPTGIRVLVVAIDGVDPLFAADVAARRGLAWWTRVLQAPRVEMPRQGGSDPVAAWMSMATGHRPDCHGALGLEARRVAGLGGRLPGAAAWAAPVLAATTDLLRLTQPVLSSGIDRREPTFWELAARAGLRTAAVNWWTTWPSSARDGIVVSERASLRLERGGALDQEVSPPALYDELVARWPAIKARAHALAEERTSELATVVAGAVTRAAEIDAIQIAIAQTIDIGELDLLTVYLPGLDIAQATLLPDDGARAVSTVAGRLLGLERLYEHLDRQIDALEAAAPDHALVVISHPGRVAANVPALLVAAKLPRADPGTPPAPPRLEDVAPTILQLVGLPISRDLTGRPRLELVAEALRQRSPVRYVDRYTSRDATLRRRSTDAQPLDDEARERLRSLGYVR